MGRTRDKGNAPENPRNNKPICLYPRQRLNISLIVKEFEESENSSAHRKGTFKINMPFEKALGTILKSKPHLPTKKPTA